MENVKFYIADVFAESKYEGNQLAVCFPDGKIEQDEMQAIAKEINYSETTFVMSGLQKNGGYDVKIFTPDSEIPFAGHPTIGTASIIKHQLKDKNASEIKLNLRVGQVPVIFEDPYAWMTQNQPSFYTKIDEEVIAKALQIEIEDINKNYPVQVVSTGLPSIIVHLNTLHAVNRCKVNHEAFDGILEKIGEANLLVFTKDTVSPENDLHARVFMFTSGHLEDPATGSANGNLAGYLLKHHFFSSKEITYTVEQGYNLNRKSLLKVKASMADDHFSIKVGGRIYVVGEGKWL